MSARKRIFGWYFFGHSFFGWGFVNNFFLGLDNFNAVYKAQFFCRLYACLL